MTYHGHRIVVLSLLCAAAPAAAQVLVDQLGYRRTAAKYVFTPSSADSFVVVDAASGVTEFRGPLIAWKVNDAATGWNVRRGDFSELTRPGRYRVRTSANATSVDFTVADSVFRGVSRAALKGFTFQRCGVSLPFSVAGWYLHGYCHTADATFHATAESTGTVVATGGWHDAGDYGKYVVNAGITIGTLLLAYDLYPDRFQADDVGMPESGNGIPDLLDEVRFELEWLLRMQSANGGVFTKLTKTAFESMVMPQNDAGTRYIYQISSTATADLAAVAARASRTYQTIDPTFAAKCRLAAERAWAFLATRPSIIPAGGFVNPSGTSTGGYGDTDDRDERLWAAAELFAATGSADHELYYSLNMSVRGLFTTGLSWQNVTDLAHLAYLTATDRTRDADLVAQLSGSLKSVADGLMTRRSTSGLHLTLVPGEFVWGSNSVALNHAMLLLVASKIHGQTSYRDGAEDQLHYVLGVNPHGRAFVTGHGSVRPMAPHHRPSAADGVVEPVPGLLVGGPNQFGGDPILSARFTAADPPAWWYADELDSYASNEIAINWNAPLVFVAGVLAGEGSSTGTLDRHETGPSELGLDPVFPNPFNPRTTVRFRLAEAGHVSLDVVDLSGRMLERLVDTDLRAGSHDTTWDAGRYASGVYVMRLTAGEHVSMQKAVLLR
ncbi:MAG: glycoside hydrolase family 9 protein [Bacteroidetes bacterium]|nr:glycoside hydrolase family 9 protein [Bacteroidota bacterium]